jgi:uncharacterized protein YjbI with pentapeptide repeats
LAERQRVVTQWLWALIGLVGTLLVVFALVVGPWLLTRFPHEGITAEQELKAKNDVRTTLVQALAGLAVAGGLVVTYRTFRQTRIEQDRTYDLRRAEQINELYTMAVEQLGHEEAPVRLGALYSLAHLAQANPDRRQTVVDVLCAYLRMPYAPPESAEPADVVAGEAPSGHRDQPGRASKRDPAQELQVRLTAERLLSEHVRRPDRVSGEDAQHVAPSPDESHWPNISLDLTGAFLIGLNLSGASVADARFAMATFSTGGAGFEGATFTGSAWFEGATFTGDARFEGATFTGDAKFEGATFKDVAWFDRATFTGHAEFDGATFTSDARFAEATFTGQANFRGATFTGNAAFTEATFTRDAAFEGATFTGSAWFEGATFTGSAWFVEATFTGSAWFVEATFTGHAEFEWATFTGNAWFEGATFTGSAWFMGATFGGVSVFEGATFTGDAWFEKATLSRPAQFTGAQVLNLGDPVLKESGDMPRRAWPNGWTVHTNADDPTRGTLVTEPPGSSLEPPGSSLEPPQG